MSEKLLIFQIGFNKCGTTSLYEFFKHNGVSSIHHGGNGGKLATSMFANHKLGRKLISPEYKDISFFSDMECINEKVKEPLYVAQNLFRKLAKQYPKSYFLLNIRDRDNWIKSRINHSNGTYLERIARKTGLTKQEVVANWVKEWDVHISNVKKFFKKHPGRLVIFNIEKDNISKIINFFRDKCGLKLNASHYEHHGSTKVKRIQKWGQPSTQHLSTFQQLVEPIASSPALGDDL